MSDKIEKEAKLEEKELKQAKQDPKVEKKTGGGKIDTTLPTQSSILGLETLAKYNESLQAKAKEKKLKGKSGQENSDVNSKTEITRFKTKRGILRSISRNDGTSIGVNVQLDETDAFSSGDENCSDVSSTSEYAPLRAESNIEGIPIDLDDYSDA
eukprot:snap_masked-scaffold_1-processed-gene-19.58-mRNA-1 protein AED:1.00 eAED:1.00 QI:0/-1/0/0/-1/1/1/0/154